MTKQKNSLDKNIGIIFFVVAILIGFTPYIFTQFQLINGIDFNKTGGIGDTIGGITAPFINLLSAALIYLALREQIRANKIQIQLFESRKEEQDDERKFNIVLKELNWCSDEFAKISFKEKIGVEAIDEVMQLDSNSYSSKINQINFLQTILGLKGYLEKLIRQIKSISSNEYKAVLSNKLLLIYRTQSKKYNSKIKEHKRELSKLSGIQEDEINKIMTFEKSDLEYLEKMKFKYYTSAFQEKNKTCAQY